MLDNNLYDNQVNTDDAFTGLRVFLVLNAALTLFTMLFIVIALSAMNVPSQNTVASDDILGTFFVEVGQAIQFLLIVLLAISVVRMIAIVGTWLQQAWGKILLYIFFIAGILIGFFNEVHILTIFDIVNLGMFYYLSRQPAVKRKNDMMGV